MPKYFRILILLGTICLFSSTAYSATPAGEEAAKLVEGLMKETVAVGITVSVGVRGEIVWSQGFGYADLEQHVPVYPDRTRFRVGSVAKPMTAVAIAQLYEQGKLDMDAPVQKYIPGFPQKKGIVTTRLLAGHLGGIRHYKGKEMLSYKNYESVSEALSIFKDDPLLHAPGSKYSYSSYGYNLLSAVVESASGEDFLDYLSTHVFKSLGMNHTEADHIYSIIPDRGRYYHLFGGVLVNAPAVDNSYKWAGGGILSTSDDLIRLGFAHLGTEHLKKETINLLWTAQKTTAGKETGYGIGWKTQADRNGHRWVGHGGGSIGGSTLLDIYPEDEVVIAIISNITGQKWNGLNDRISELFLDQN